MKEGRRRGRRWGAKKKEGEREGRGVGEEGGSTLQFARRNPLVNTSSHTVLPCLIASNCVLFPPATPNRVIDVSPLEWVYGRDEEGVR